MAKRGRPKSTRSVRAPDSSSHHETSHVVAKRRKTHRSTINNSMASASERTNETINNIPEPSQTSRPDMAFRKSRYHLRNAAPVQGSSVADAREQPVPRDDSSFEDDEEAISDMMGDQRDTNNSTLCHHCQYIFDNWSKWTDDKDYCYPHYDNEFQLMGSAKNGCSLCYQFCRNELVPRYGKVNGRYGGFAGARVRSWEKHYQKKGSTRISLQFDKFEVDMIPSVPQRE
jgi:hypothetical protein